MLEVKLRRGLQLHSHLTLVAFASVALAGATAYLEHSGTSGQLTDPSQESEVDAADGDVPTIEVVARGVLLATWSQPRYKLLKQQNLYRGYGGRSVVEAFTPGIATLTARVFANPHARMLPALFYDIVFPVRVKLPVPIGRPLFSSDEPVTDVQLEFIDLGSVEWRALPGRDFLFPSGPDDEYPDGSVYLGGTHHSAFLTRLRFGELMGKSLVATLNIDFDLSLLRPLPDGLEREFSVQWQLPLAVDPARLDVVMVEARQVLG